jgi:hypothetical protein
MNGEDSASPLVSNLGNSNECDRQLGRKHFLNDTRPQSLAKLF